MIAYGIEVVIDELSGRPPFATLDAGQQCLHGSIPLAETGEETRLPEGEGVVFGGKRAASVDGDGQGCRVITVSVKGEDLARDVLKGHTAKLRRAEAPLSPGWIAQTVA
jgi:hypothetical protein